MTEFKFIINNLVYYIRKNLLLALGVAISGAVLTGALVVGDSVTYSLNRIVDQRLGSVTHVLKAGDRYFTSALSDRVETSLQRPVSSVLMQEGSAVADGGARRINHVQVLGVGPSFDEMAGTGDYFRSLAGDSIVISRNLANRLSVGVGDELLLRIEKATLIPLNAPFVSDAETTVSLRATVGGIADDRELGRFNLKVSQTAPFNVFLSLDRLQELMDFQGRVNVMLFRDDRQAGVEAIQRAVNEQFSAADAGLQLRWLEDLQLLEVTSGRVFIDDALSGPLFDLPAENELATSSEGILTYFVNR
jgi:putative ABC transport system permease protein